MALDKRHTQLLEEGTQLFEKTRTLTSLWQELAENFYPERADFTVTRQVGEEFASNLDTSYPIIARRDLGDAIGAMLRPKSKVWFHNRAKRETVEDEAARQWLAMTDRVQTRAIYDIESQFTRSTKEADHDWATFGQAVLSSEIAKSPTSGPVLLHRNWHLRDVRWSENSFGGINAVHRRWLPGARELKGKFPNKVSKQVNDLAEKEPFKPVNVRHIMVLSSEYEKKFRQPWVSIYIDCDNQTLLEEKGSWTRYYIIPRWETVSGSQYAYSPAAIAALPDGRLLQAMTYTLLTAGEFAIEPPMVGVQEALKGAIEIFPGGFTPVDAQYDERLGEALRPLYKGGEKAIPLGLKMNQDTRDMISMAFYLDKLALPSAGLGGMSPLEVSERIGEFIRQALPLFEPMEEDYNGALMEQDFELLLRGGAFGPAERIPESLHGQETEFRFEGPLREAIDRLKGQQFLEAKGLAVEAAQIEPSSIHAVDWEYAHRDAQHGVGTPPDWMRSIEAVQERVAADQKAQQLQNAMQVAGGAAQVAEQAGNAAQALNPEGAAQEGEGA